jgi:fluoride ion exporter CrcB/FEX
MIENSLLVYKRTPPPEAVAIAKMHGWDYDALQDWCRHREESLQSLPSVSSRSFAPNSESSSVASWCTLPFLACILLTVYAVLTIGVLSRGANNANANMHRTMMYACFLAPLGTIARWRSTQWISRQPISNWTWFPMGTFANNLLGCALSIALAASEYRIQQRQGRAVSQFWRMATIRAVKVGFADTLTTVSTLVAEINRMSTQNSTRAYAYILMTLAACSCVSSVIYVCIVGL